MAAVATYKPTNKEFFLTGENSAQNWTTEAMRSIYIRHWSQDEVDRACDLQKDVVLEM